MDYQLPIYGLVIAVNLMVGFRLLWRGRAADAHPELLLGTAFALDGIEWAFWLLSTETAAAGIWLGDGFAVACRATIVAHNIALLFFTLTVFRPRSHTALGVVLSLSALMATSLIIGTALGDWNGYRSDRIWIWLETATQSFAYVWTLVESALYYARMRKRQAHGLADPIVVNRLLLWAFYGATAFGSSAFYLISIGVATFAGEYPFALDVLMIGCTSLSALAIWFAFFPPRAYRSWIESGARGVGA